MKLICKYAAAQNEDAITLLCDTIPNIARIASEALPKIAKDGNETAFKFLVEKAGADIDFKDDNNYTPLMHAAKEGHLPIVNYLCDKGVNHSHSTKGGMTALRLSKIKGHTEIKTLLNTYSLSFLCPVCKEQPNKAVVMPCKHSFCLNCIEKIEEKCPVCRSKINDKIKPYGI